MERVLAIDYGRARIGLAVSDPLGLTARPLPAISGKDPDAAVTQIQAVAAEEDVDRIVIGMPYQLDGREGPATEAVRRFVQRLQKHLELPIDEEDERLTSKQAHAAMKSAGLKHKKRRQHVDSAAAVLLLQSHLKRRRNGP